MLNIGPFIVIYISGCHAATPEACLTHPCICQKVERCKGHGGSPCAAENGEEETWGMGKASTLGKLTAQAVTRGGTKPAHEQVGWVSDPWDF